MTEQNRNKEFDNIEDAVFIEVKKENENNEDNEDEIIRLQKSNSNKIIFGVCGGLGEFFQLKANFIRIAFITTAIFTQWVFLLYLLLAVLIPKQKNADIEINNSETVGSYFGLLIVFVVLFDFITSQFPSLSFIFRIVDKDVIWGLYFLIAGFYLYSRANYFVQFNNIIPSTNLYKSRMNKIIGGVCSGLAEYLEFSRMSVRVVWLLLSILSFGMFFIIYVIMVFIIPYKKGEAFEKV
ncbi:MAG: PspC domain-containing protein [bacterium]